MDETALRTALRPLLELAGHVPEATEQDLATLMDDVVAAAVEVLRVDCIGFILLDDEDRPRVVAASDPTAAVLEQAQADLGEGPGSDSFRTGETVAVTDLRATARYPRLRPRLSESPVRAVLSSPIRVSQAVVGNFNAAMCAPHQWTSDQRRANDVYADVIGMALRLTARSAGADSALRQPERQGKVQCDPAQEDRR